MGCGVSYWVGGLVVVMGWGRSEGKEVNLHCFVACGFECGENFEEGAGALL